MKLFKLSPVFVSLVSVFLFNPISAQAMSYYELEVYPYNTASQGETEIENQTTAGSVLRSSMEVNYGISDRVELAAYADFTNGFDAAGNSMAFAAARIRGRTRFSEKGELPLDLGAYLEFELPRDPSSNELLVGEVKLTMEKDLGRFTLNLNPSLEHQLAVNDGGTLGWEAGYSAGVAYRANRTFRPHFDAFGTVFTGTETVALLSPALDVKVGHGLKFTARAAFGLTDASEKQLIGGRVEYEF